MLKPPDSSLSVERQYTAHSAVRPAVADIEKTPIIRLQRAQPVLGKATTGFRNPDPVLNQPLIHWIIGCRIRGEPVRRAICCELLVRRLQPSVPLAIDALSDDRFDAIQFTAKHAPLAANVRM